MLQNILLKSCFFGKRTVSLGSLDFKIEEWTAGSGHQDSTGSEEFQNLLLQTPNRNSFSWFWNLADTHFGVFLSFFNMVFFFLPLISVLFS